MPVILISMPSNIEIKARLPHPSRTRALAEKLADGPPKLLVQEDTFFPSPNGRLKLRCFPDGHGELIFYQRANVAGTKQSNYQISRTHEPAGLLEVLANALGTLRRVVKKRTLIMCGQTRIHLDEVEGLGHFLELEVVRREDQSPEEGHEIAQRLMRALEVRNEDLIEGAYADLLAAQDPT